MKTSVTLRTYHRLTSRVSNDKRNRHIYSKLQVSLARLGAGFGSALADIFQTESLRILAERISQWGIDTRH